MYIHIYIYIIYIIIYIYIYIHYIYTYIYIYPMLQYSTRGTIETVREYLETHYDK